MKDQGQFYKKKLQGRRSPNFSRCLEEENGGEKGWQGDMSFESTTWHFEKDSWMELLKKEHGRPEKRIYVMGILGMVPSS